MLRSKTIQWILGICMVYTTFANSTQTTQEQISGIDNQTNAIQSTSAASGSSRRFNKDQRIKLGQGITFGIVGAIGAIAAIITVIFECKDRCHNSMDNPRDTTDYTAVAIEYPPLTFKIWRTVLRKPDIRKSLEETVNPKNILDDMPSVSEVDEQLIKAKQDSDCRENAVIALLGVLCRMTDDDWPDEFLKGLRKQEGNGGFIAENIEREITEIQRLQREPDASCIPDGSHDFSLIPSSNISATDLDVDDGATDHSGRPNEDDKSDSDPSVGDGPTDHSGRPNEDDKSDSDPSVDDGPTDHSGRPTEDDKPGSDPSVDDGPTDHSGRPNEDDKSDSDLSVMATAATCKTFHPKHQPYILIRRPGNVRKCNGCGGALDQVGCPPGCVQLVVVQHWENKNVYYHYSLSCIRKVNPAFNPATIQYDLRSLPGSLVPPIAR